MAAPTMTCPAKGPTSGPRMGKPGIGSGDETWVVPGGCWPYTGWPYVG